MHIARRLASPLLMNVIASIFLFLVVSGHVIWFLERGANPDHFPPRRGTVSPYPLSIM